MRRRLGSKIMPRHVEPADWLRFEQAMAEIFTAFGMDPDTATTERTPTRFLRALYDATAGYEGDESGAGETVCYYLGRGRRPRGILLWNVFGQVDAARELIRAAEPVERGALAGRVA
jgi:hypothetical protein